MNSFEPDTPEYKIFKQFEADFLANANRMKMILLCREAGSYAAAAHLIAKQTQRPLSIDSIKAWTCNLHTKRARPCPDWAINALERSIKRNAKKTKSSSERKPNCKNPLANEFEPA